MIRRRILLTAPIALAACGNQPSVSPKTVLQTTSSLVAAGVDTVAAVVLAKPGLATDRAAKITAAQTTVDDANKIIQGATSTVAGNGQALVTAVKLAEPLLITEVGPASDEALAIKAAMALLPTVLAAAGVTATAAGPVAGMDPVRARLILQGYVGK